jgi:hypothetical protein
MVMGCWRLGSTLSAGARPVEAQGAGRSPGWTGHHGRGAFSRGSGAWLDGTKHTSNLFLDELCSAFPGRYGACA